MNTQRLAILTEGLFLDHHAKTAHGVIRYGQREVVAVVDSVHAGTTASELMPFCLKPVPIVGSIKEAVDAGANCLLIGVAPTGGKLAQSWRALLVEAVEQGMDIEAGLHTLLGSDPELTALANASGATIRDLRAAPPDLDVPRGPGMRRDSLKVVHSVGTDVAIGKKTVTIELTRAAQAQGHKSVFVPTGQTGIAIAGWGIAVDHVVSDYVAGAGEWLVDEGARRGDLLFVEGQGALFHPAYSGVTLSLLHGVCPDVLVLTHRGGPVRIGSYPNVELPPLADIAAEYERICRPVYPTKVAAIALSTVGLDEDTARGLIEETEKECGLVCDDVVRFGADRILRAVLAEASGRATNRPPAL
jgi:uncharacterized NAD-dependent epimerase/dehydratase family protein